MNLQIFTCPNCIKKKTTSNTGESTSGFWVHPSTRSKHWSCHNFSLDNLKNLALNKNLNHRLLNDLSIHCMAQHAMRCQSTKLPNCSRTDTSSISLKRRSDN
ncbi:hypothetical protein VP01_1124g3 [Puccinia sorghi]|uniref:Uncharacterized protein n=1 Tax=Puccinia sorghi TaxID=27349 RepID=A0A0L6VTQ9_9BASI|nr:hypothetical protein VP01_1124g3 [Puccinia sorghi]